MADLNKMLADINAKGIILEQNLRDFLRQYENLYHEANNQFVSERNVTGSMEGLEDFYRMVNTARRNRDVIGSLMRGIKSLRPMDKFRIVEEDIKPPERKPRRRKSEISEKGIEELNRSIAAEANIPDMEDENG